MNHNANPVPMSLLLKYVLSLAVVVALAVATALVLLNTEPAVMQPASSSDAPAEEEGVPAQLSVDERPSRLVGQHQDVELPGRLPSSLEGTEMPRQWARVNANGHLIPTPALRLLFEYYLSALGEETLPQLVARIERALATLNEPARSEALATLGDYLDYKLAVGELEDSYGASAALNTNELQRRMTEVQALRRTYLDADTADVFFSTDEAVDRFQIERLRVSQNDDLSEQEKAQRMAQLEEQLPEPLREARRETRRFAEYEQAQRELADDPEALKDYRESLFGEEDARRLEQVEAEQRDWERRWAAYREEMEVLGRAGLVGPELAAAIERLREQHFNEQERIRAQALDSIQ